MAKLKAEDRERQKEIGARITDQREALRLTQPVVAERVGVSLRAYQNWESGDTRIAWPNLERLAGILKMEADAILHGPIDEQDEDEEPIALPTHLNDLMRAFEDRLAALEDGQTQILGLLRELSRTALEAELHQGPPSTRQRAPGSDAATQRRKDSGPAR